MQADISTTPNPKDLIGATKPGLRHVPPGPLYLIGLAMDDGARKYGAFNWRKSPIAASIYLDACKRHLDSWYQGAELAEDSGLPHLAHAAANLQILLDAIQQGSLIDDRPHHNVPLDRILVDLAQLRVPVFEVEPPAVAAVPAAPAAPAVPEIPDPAPKTESGVAEPAPQPVAEKPKEPAPAPKPVAGRSPVGANAWSDDDQRHLLRAALGEGVPLHIVAERIGRTPKACEIRLSILQGKFSARPAPDWAADYIRQVTGPAPAKAPAIAVGVKQPVPTPAPARRDADATSELTLLQRDLLRHVAGLDDSFAPEDDLYLVEQLAAGAKTPVVASELGVTAEDVIQRFRAMLTPEIRGGNGRITIGGQGDLLAVLRHRVGIAA